MGKLGKRDGWEIPYAGFRPDDVGLTNAQADLFEQIIGWKGKNVNGNPVVNFILVYNQPEALTLTDFALTPLGAEIRTPQIEGVYSYVHEKKSHPSSADDWATITKNTPAQGLRPYKVYVVNLSQSGLAPPSVIVIENTLDGTPEWTGGEGAVSVTLAGAFPPEKTVVVPSYGNEPFSGKGYQTAIGTGDTVDFSSIFGIALTTIEIRVYP